MSLGIVYASSPIALWSVLPPLQATEVAPLLGQVAPTVADLHVYTPGPDLVEVDAVGGNWVFDRAQRTLLACTEPDRCADRLLRSTRAPAWIRLETGERLRIGSQTEDVTNAGWGTPDNTGLWVSPIFSLDVFDTNGRPRELVVTLDEYGC